MSTNLTNQNTQNAEVEVIEEVTYVQELDENDTDVFEEDDNEVLDMDLVYRTVKARVIEDGEFEGNFYRIIEDDNSSNTFVGVLGEYTPLLEQTVIKIYKTNPNSEDGVSMVMLTKNEATELMKFLQGNIELAK